MIKTLLKYTLIILVNLFAFLGVWHILDGVFSRNGLFKLIFVFISVLPLIYLAHKVINKQIKTNIDSNDRKWK